MATTPGFIFALLGLRAQPCFFEQGSPVTSHGPQKRQQQNFNMATNATSSSEEDTVEDTVASFANYHGYQFESRRTVGDEEEEEIVLRVVVVKTSQRKGRTEWRTQTGEPVIIVRTSG